ncbi:MAG: cytochrome C oxidase subunit IV family protein [Chthoniobacter sp.]|nr:cytochrome C oxidase subunit IV family protein [Chthoniobacter sp.]
MSQAHDHGKEITPGTAHEPATGGDHPHFDMHLGLYLGVGGFLLVATAVTVWLSYVDFDKMFGGHGWNIIIAMIVATVKVGFVGAIFMHLKGEKKLVWQFLYFTLFFVAGLFLLTLLNYSDPIFGTSHAHH